MPDRKTVLLIDDEEMIRTLARAILERAGCKVLPASSGEDGLRQFEHSPDTIDLIIVDYSLLGLSGQELLRALRSVVSDIPIIISSGDSINIADLPVELKSNVQILPKPYLSSDLLQAVKAVLGISLVMR